MHAHDGRELSWQFMAHIHLRLHLSQVAARPTAPQGRTSPLSSSYPPMRCGQNLKCGFWVGKTGTGLGGSDYLPAEYPASLNPPPTLGRILSILL